MVSPSATETTVPVIVAAWVRVLAAARRKMSRCLIRIFAIMWLLNLNSCLFRWKKFYFSRFWF